MLTLVAFFQIAKNMPKDIESRKRKTAQDREAPYSSKKSKIEVSN